MKRRFLPVLLAMAFALTQPTVVAAQATPDIVRLEPGDVPTRINRHGICRDVQSLSGIVMIPTRTAAELWRSDRSFLSNQPANVKVAPCGQILQMQDLALGNAHACGIEQNGTAVCWGDNEVGQLGDGTTTNRVNPVRVKGVSGAIQIVAVSNNTCVLLDTGRVMCWGDTNWGNIGNGDGGRNDSRPQPNPQYVSGINDATFITTDCAVHNAGRVSCWGRNTFGGVGLPAGAMGYNTPQSFTALGTGISEVWAGTAHRCALKTNGQVYCWGSNTRGQLGKPTADDMTHVPQLVMSDAMALQSRNNHSCAVKRNGSVVCWGWDSFGQVGNGAGYEDLVATPQLAQGLTSGYRSVVVGARASCAIGNTGSVKCWGNGAYGALGDGREVNSDVPVDADEFGTNSSRITMGNGFSCVSGSGTLGLACLGNNAAGALGSGIPLGDTSKSLVEVLFKI